ncbi:MAG: putative flippase AglD2 [Candidatus Methanohalarchaeum thermophilum]|uniref:Flippase AglD2 n=1 Tax=Methanohalarchaeum thermophilum TaxID=1903181 RepID=A0A1Q6DSU1_METT1|nr:MAG: putative flippase AglD2 [Candidatus Methanohalarchaeum thermophilum]
MNDKIKTISKFVISFTLIAVLLYKTDISKIISQLKNIKITFFVLALFLSFIGLVISAKKWQILLKAKGENQKLLKVFKHYYIGAFSNLFLPSTIGGDAVKATTISKDLNNKEEGFSSVFMERYTGLISLIMISSFGFTYSYELLGKKILTAFILVLVLFGTITFLALSEKSQKILNFLPSKLPLNLREKILNLHFSIREYKDQKKAILYSIIVSIFFHVIKILYVFVLALALGIEIPILFLIVMVPVSQIILFLPISIQGIGVRETLYVSFLNEIGLPASTSLSLSLLIEITIIIKNIPGILPILKK